MEELELITPPAAHRVDPSAPGELRLALIGELDITATAAVAAAVAPLLDGRIDRLVLDLGELTFADSSAIALWVGWAQQVPRIELAKVSPLVRRVIETMGLVGILRPG